MHTKKAAVDLIHDAGAVLILRMESAGAAETVARAAVEGGIRVLEIPLTVPDALGAISRLSKEFGDDVLVGAGTVLDEEAARRSVDSGAGLLVTPHVAPDVMAAAREADVAALGGAFTPSEVLASARSGADLVKLFPAEVHGPAYLSSILAPLAHIPVCPTGGVSPDNVGQWVAAGASAVGMASAITKAGGPDYEPAPITLAAARFLARLDEARAV
ncbi:bifunctional 4-hydroxy-2-oxoglutarate aldolase/2-dehydro-3-deoxy-phosphogluconate aldolase [Nocardioides insulae]|uniref:bifunctional 4-hydroxy-2-oxoglutarate aldolase/2-dehydro-3-deoxy-phosphogluconate aldolase n=1 Tax=Nocardioides insulae TaxID=394734 RepID=UPI0004104C8E|nr:bifunctional 4-hydroxy-2-oxoglutarate aldolase/2-dehydro-3-deoxy-phosphogluconate aldolase [Nocardioides insulae]